ncbi:MAG TPA: toxin-antitoxin system YwqK family antitoxin [Bacteroidales bacterium]|nr:toxin-antitoxin system YwqK family antitoxin [Bacteroidales bacterium]
MQLKSIIFSLLLSLLTSSLLYPQFNQTDEKGLKQGHWRKNYPHGTIMYEGDFKDNHPVGEFKRYFENGIIQSVLVYNPDGTEADATLYYQNGKPASKGNYKNQLKEGKWQFFGEDSSYVMSEEFYMNNLKEGLSIKYYPDGKVAEELFYKKNLKNGAWSRNYENGKPWIRAFYSNNMLDGKYESWYENGMQQLTGQYKFDRKDGLWNFFNADGKLKYKITFTQGIPDSRELENEAAEMINSLEKKKGSIPDPEVTGEMW